MDYTSIHVYGHLLSDDILHNIEQDKTFVGNREQDYGIDSSTSAAIDYVWSSLRNDWHFYKERSYVKDTYGTKKSRDLMERLFQSLGYELQRQHSSIETSGKQYEITYVCPQLSNMPFIVIGDRINDTNAINTQDRCSLDYRAKGQLHKKSAHATMLEYLNSTENIYGIISNGQTLRLIRNSGQLVKLSYIEFDLRRMLEEDKYTEFCLMFRLLHSSHFRVLGDEQCAFEKWFNLSIESGNRIRNGLSKAVQTAMEIIGNAAIRTKGEGNNLLRSAFSEKIIDDAKLNKELIHLIYRILFLFIIEDRDLVYQIPESQSNPNHKQLCKFQELYKKYYAASRFRALSELRHLRSRKYFDLWKGLMDTFHLFESGNYGEKIGIKPLGGVLFDSDTLHYLKDCDICNEDLLSAFSALNEFVDEKGQKVKINYTALDVEEFGSVYEGILEMRAFVQQGVTEREWKFSYVGGLDRQSTSSYYTRPDLVQSLIHTTLEPVINEKIEKLRTPEEKVKSLLSMKVCDAASGSGHIVLAMARTIAWYVCTIRTGEDNPASLDYREALREVIQKCVYAVDYNPDAVELCKVVLWIEGYCAGKPLSFLDHHIRCGNSVVGITDLDMIMEGVPNEAFCAEDKETKRKVIATNKEALNDLEMVKAGPSFGLNMSLVTKDFTIQNIDSEQVGLAEKVRVINAMPEETLAEQISKQNEWNKLMESPRVKCLRRACDIYTYAFYKQFKDKDMESYVDETGFFTAYMIPYTRTVFQALQEIKYIDNPDSDPNFHPVTKEFCDDVRNAADRYKYFHWCVEFPEVFANKGGFDVMCGNPPWDKIKVEDKKWFESHGRSDIVNRGTAAQRKCAIAILPDTDPELYKEYHQSLIDAESMSRFIRMSKRFKLTANMDIDLYPLFAEHCLMCSKESWGLIMPTGIATSDSNKLFFNKLIDENRLVSIFDFENKEGLFDIHREYKFSILTAGRAQEVSRTTKCGFWLTRLDHLLEPARIYTLSTNDFAMLNPNTKTCPVFRTSKDAKLTAKIYYNCQVIINENTSNNPWNVKLGRMFDMANDSGIFYTFQQLIEQGAEYNNGDFLYNGQKYVPLYEGKMFYLYNHLYGEWPIEGERPESIPEPPLKSYKDVNYNVVPWYWIPLSYVKNKLIKRNRDNEIVWEWKHKWLIGIRDITTATTERTFMASLIPYARGVGHTATLLYTECGCISGSLLLAMMSSLVFDYVAKQKCGRLHMSIFIVKQLPVLTPEQIPESLIMPIVSRVAQLCYFNHDLDGWAEELFNELTPLQKLELPELGELNPFVFDPDKRAILQAELDAIFAHLYGLSTEDLKYILDPEDVCGKGCINETFRVLKNNEIREFGEYRTKRLVMEAWYKFGYDKISQ